jgi:hypothetical protein
MIKYYRTDTRLGEADLTPPEEGRKKKGTGNYAKEAPGIS